jgi:hypothetical protein
MTAPVAIPSRPGTHRLPCPHCRKGKRDDALAVTVEQDGSAVWICHRCGERGSTGRQRRERGERRRPTPAPDTQAKVDRALSVWWAGQPIAGTPAETYLLTRGLDPAELRTDPPGWPETLRWHAEQGALVVAVNDGGHGCVRAVQRVFLTAAGEPVREPDGDKRKRALGPLKGNAARLSCWPDPEGWWGLAEGAETALAARQITGVPTWAAISASNMPNVTPPHWARHVVLFADNDSNSTGLREASKALVRVRTFPTIETARVVMADRIGQDAADLLTEGV